MHRHRSSVNFGGTFLPENIRMKKINKMPEFYMIIAQKIFFPNLGGGHVPRPSAPVSYAYGKVNCWNTSRTVSLPVT